MPERSSSMFQARLGRSRSSYIIPSRSQKFTTPKLHMASMQQQNSQMSDSNKKPAIPPRSLSRPRQPNKLQKKRQPEKTHLGFLVKDVKDDTEEYSRGTLGGFWVLGEQLEANGMRTRNSSWYYQSEPDIRPLSIAVKKGPDTSNIRAERPWHTRNSSSSSQESDLSDIWQSAQSSPFSTLNSPMWESDNTSCSSVYSNDELDRAKTPSTHVDHLLNSAEVLAESYRSLLASRASMRTPLPPPVPPKHSARYHSIKRKPIGTQPTAQNPEPKEKTLSIRRKPIKTQASAQSFDRDGNLKPKTLRRVISQHSLRRMTISSHPAFSSSASSSSTDDSGHLSDSSSGCKSHDSNFSSPSAQPPRYSLLSNMDSCELSRSVHTLTHHLSKALLLQDFCSPSDSMHDLNRNRKSVIQIQSLIDAYEELQEELELGHVQANERKMVWEMNGVVGEWLNGLYHKNGI